MRGAAVTIGGRDDSGAQANGGDVTLTLPAGGATTLTAQQLESGDTDLTGRLGAGTGRWRLTVSSDLPLEVVNIVASTGGYWNNLSTTAVPGAAPVDRAGLNERFVDRTVIFKASGRRSTLEAEAGERFAETTQADGVTDMGDYSYTGIGPDAGRLSLDYDDGDTCRANLYFATRTSGWFASHCTGIDHPAEGTWLGGTWVVEAEEDDGAGEVAETIYEVNDSLPGVPTSGFFVPAVTSGASVSTSASGTTVALNNGGYIELTDGTRYTCASADGCAIVNGTVTAGTVAGRSPGTGDVDRFPSFRTAPAPGNRTYTVGTAIDTLTLPQATGGNGDLTYSLSPSVPGLTFNSTARQLTGAPTTAGAYAMTYTVTDEDGDTDTLGFTITVSDGTSAEGSLGVCQVGMTLSSGQNCTYPATTDEFSVNARGRGSFLGRLAGIRIRIDNETINGQDYDFEASHQGDGVWRINRVEGSTQPPTGGVSGDHGDDRATATRIEEGSDTEGVLDSGDVDYFRIVVDAPGTLEAYTSSNLDTVGRLEDADGAVLGTNEDGGAGTNFRISENVSPGTYFVRVAGFGSRATGRYTLHVRLTESDSGMETDNRAALMALYNATDGPNWAAKSNWGSDSPLSQWHGVSADSSGRVVRIDLRENKLSGPIPPELGGLDSLRTLHLANNQLSGSIPAELGGLDSLQRLRLSGNQLSGCIPDGLRDVADNDHSTLGLTYCAVSGTSPSFAGVSGPGNRSYSVGSAIAALTLPAASGGDGALTYSLSPEVPGLIFNATASVRELTGAPSRAGTYDMTYRVRDTDGDTDSLSFTITVTEPG